MNTLQSRIDEIKKEIKDIKDFLSDYSLEIVEEYDLTSLSSTRLSDVIQEVAYSNTDIYASDLHDWVKQCNKSFNYLNQARSEFGTCEDFDEEIRNAQYLYIVDIIYNEINEIKEIKDLTEELEELKQVA